jgi:ABC-type transporter Mla subunit MlaD
MEFENLGQLSQKLSLMSNQAYDFKKDARFDKQHDVADIYNQFLDKADLIEDSDDELDVAAAEIMWGKRAINDESALGQADQEYLRLRHHES